MTLTLDRLNDTFAQGAAAIRLCTRLQPVGGKGDKVFPPTFPVKDGQLRYATEQRRIDGKPVACVLLDSVASQANRMELALLDARERGTLQFPLVGVDFGQSPAAANLRDLGFLTTLHAPHRLADALLRDSVLDGKPFRYSEIGQRFVDARVDNATSMYALCPHALLFGIWDSTGPKGGLGAKFARTLVSEIVGVGAEFGVRTAMRVDPLAIVKSAGSGQILKAADADEGWTLDPKQAALDPKKNPIKYSGQGQDSDGNKKGAGEPSSLVHGNIITDIDRNHGGATIDYALQTSVISLAGLRRLRFQTAIDGRPLGSDGQRYQAEDAARSVVAALGLAALVGQRFAGLDLRSRCHLVPESGADAQFEIVGRNGEVVDRFDLSAAEAASLLNDAHAHAAKHGLGWDPATIRLEPAAKLCQLIEASRNLVRAGEAKAGE